MATISCSLGTIHGKQLIVSFWYASAAYQAGVHPERHTIYFARVAVVYNTQRCPPLVAFSAFLLCGGFLNYLWHKLFVCWLICLLADLCSHYTGVIQKRNNLSGDFRVVLKKTRSGKSRDHCDVIAVEKSYFFTHTKTKSRRFQIPPICNRFRKSPVSWRISVNGRPSRWNKAAFSCGQDETTTLSSVRRVIAVRSLRLSVH